MNAPMPAGVTETPILELEDSWEAINAWFLEHDLTDLSLIHI